MSRFQNANNFLRSNFKHLKNIGFIAGFASIIGGYYALRTDIFLDITKRHQNKEKVPEYIYPVPDNKEAQHRKIAQSSDFKTAVNIARSSRACESLFRSPPPSILLKQKWQSMESHFRFILGSLSVEKRYGCANYLTRCALTTYLGPRPVQSDQYMFPAIPDIDDEYLDFQRRQHIPLPAIKIYLEALLAHSVIPSHRESMVKNDVLTLLYQVQEKHQEDNIKSLIGQIVGSIALDSCNNNTLLVSGWIGILSSWSNNDNIEVRLPAVRALANMDQEQNSMAHYAQGLYLLHPQFKERDQEIEADIIFVHGLMGGAFRTWRQNDQVKPQSSASLKKNHTENPKSIICDKENCDIAGGSSTNYTYCWPKDWLATDFPNMRYIAVDYSSHVSEWKSRCPLEKEKRSIRFRSQELLEKLLQADIGNRPIIWVSHSMGGLLVKEMLLEAAASDDVLKSKVLRNTIGTVFYSVPHKGGDALGMSKSMLLLFQPSMEAQEMKKNCPRLLKMNQDFKVLARLHQIQILSFGENIPSKWGLHWKSILVPSESANPGTGLFYELSTDHLSTCKPLSKMDDAYTYFTAFLSDALKSKSAADKTPERRNNYHHYIFSSFDF